MGLSGTITNALNGMQIGQRALEVVSQNVANAGTPGFHRRSSTAIEYVADQSVAARNGLVTRAFNQSLQQHFGHAVSESSFADIRADFLDRVQVLFGKPGQDGTLGSAYNAFSKALSALATSPDNIAARTDVLQKAQILTTSLNALTSDVQLLRQEVERKLSSNVAEVNAQLQAVYDLNRQLSDRTIEQSSRANLLDQRDRLISSLSEQMDLQVTYRADDSVSLMSRSGISILDSRVASFRFDPGGVISANSRADAPTEQDRLGLLTVTMPSGSTIDVRKQEIFSSGELAGLLSLRDNDLVAAQDRLDEVASTLAQAMSTIVTEGTPVTSGSFSGRQIDLADMQSGNEFQFSYLENGVSKTVRVQRVDDPSKLPVDYKDANGARVIGLDFAAGLPGMARKLQTLLGGSVKFEVAAGSSLNILSQTGGATQVTDLTKRTTATANQNGTLALSLFVDGDGRPYTGFLDGLGQKTGFAGRIKVNTEIANDNRLLVKYSATTPIGDPKRATLLANNLAKLRFDGGRRATEADVGDPMFGTVGEFLSYAINFQGHRASVSADTRDTRQMSLDAVAQRMDDQYGVDMDEEMSRLLQLQNAYSANTRVMQTAQQLLDALLNSTR